MNGKLFGYVRVSTSKHNEQRQIDLLVKEFGPSTVDIFVDKISGLKTERPALAQLQKVLREGDKVIVESLSRILRTCSDLLHLLGDCGSRMNYIKATGGYVCGSKHRSGDKECTRHFVKHVELKAAVMSDLRKIAGGSVNSNSLIQQAMKMLDTEFEEVSSDIAQVNKELDTIKKKRMELVDKLVQNTLDDETFKMHNEGLRNKQQGLEKEASELEQKLSQEREDKEAIHAFQLEAQRFAQLDSSDELG